MVDVPDAADVAEVDSGLALDVVEWDARDAVDDFLGGTLPLCGPDESCPLGTFCARALPQRFCTRMCGPLNPCGSDGVCVDGVCRPRCEPGIAGCELYGGACRRREVGGVLVGDCVPTCFSDRAPGSAYYCTPSDLCEPASGLCARMPPGLRPVGAPCRDNAECSSRQCRTETDPTTGAATGFVDGMCVSWGRFAGRDEYFVGGSVNANCPLGTALAPGERAMSGSAEPCLPACRSNTDCRLGYSCRNAVDAATGRSGATSVCTPTDCTRAPTACLLGTHCEDIVHSDGGRETLCVATTPRDGGIDP